MIMHEPLVAKDGCIRTERYPACVVPPVITGQSQADSTVNSDLEAAASTQVRSPVGLIYKVRVRLIREFLGV